MGIANSRILIVQPFLFRFSGSEIVAIELASALVESGAEVAIVSWGHSAMMAGEVADVPGVLLLDLDSEEFTEYLAQGVPDLVWIHQGLIPEQLLLASGQKTKFVFAHLSTINPFEMPFAPEIERQLASSIWFVAPETLEWFEQTGEFEGVPKNRLHVFGNPVPFPFHIARAIPSGTLSSALVVSNHIPRELIESIDLLRDAGVEVTVVGAEQGGVEAVAQRVTPELLTRHDLVITIGKTVQYALCAGVPVYCYDHFGGPGWLSENNFELARYHNFSGRGFDKKSSSQIFDEVTSGFAIAQDYATESIIDARSQFSYARVLAELTKLLEQEAPNMGSLSDDVLNGYFSAHKTVRDFGFSFYQGIALTQQHVSNLEAQAMNTASYTERLETELDVANAHIANLEMAVAEAHEHIAARRPVARARRLGLRAWSALRRMSS